MSIDLDRLRRDGVCVCEQVVGRAEVDALLALLADHVGVRLDDPATWRADLPVALPVWAHQAQWDVRQAPGVYEACRAAWGRDDLLVSQDALGFKAPLAVTPDAEHAAAMALHWDRDPRLPPALQGVLYLTDVGQEDGAFCGVPGIFADLAGWLARHPDADLSGDAPLDLEDHPVVAVAARAGDLVLFDSRLPHGNTAHTGSRPRVVQYVAMQPAGFWGERPADHAALHASGRANPAFRDKPGFDGLSPWPPAELTDLGRRLAGYEPWPEALASLWTDPDVMRHLGGPRPPDRAREAATALLAEGGRPIELDGDVVGVCALRWTTDASPHDARELELVVLLAPQAWGRGLATAAARRLLDGAHEPVVALTQAGNHASRRLLDRLGFRADGGFERFGQPQVRYVLDEAPRPS